MKTAKTKKQSHEVVAVIAEQQTTRDAIAALLVVSVVINMFILTAWLVLKVTSAYDSEVAAFLFTR